MEMSDMENTATATDPAAMPDETPSPDQLGITLEAIERLEMMLRVVIEYTGFSYTTGHEGLDYHTGERSAHRCDYNLVLRDGISLGRVEVSRLWPFKESELRMLECCLADFCLRLDLIIAGEPQRPQGADPTP